MRLLINRSIKQRLTLIIMSVSSISVLITTLVISLIGVNQMKENILHEMSGVTDIVGASNTGALSFDDYNKVDDLLHAYERYQIITQACIYDVVTPADIKPYSPVGRYMNYYHAPATDCRKELFGSGDIISQLKDSEVIGEDSIRIVKAIYKDANIIGYIYVESTLDPIHSYVRNQTNIAITVGLVALAISYFLAINLQKAISRPILSLSDTARRISQDKDYSIRAPQAAGTENQDKNELVILTTSFNNMLSEISLRDGRLKKQNVDLERAKDAAESANRAKSQFLANISHELRTPLNAVIGFSSILMNQLFGPLGDQKYWEYAKDINESGTHLLDIINDILDLSKAEAGRLELNFEEVHISKSINKCITILSERAEKNQVAIITDIPKTLPPIVADRLRFIQILLNILSNAVKFTKAGGKVSISVRTRELSGEITHFVIVIEDTGIGMSAQDIEKAFQSFGQVDSGLNRKYEGTGLGLPLTNKLMDLHNGTIVFESEIGKGTKVTLTFPALPPEMPQA